MNSPSFATSLRIALLAASLAVGACDCGSNPGGTGDGGQDGGTEGGIDGALPDSGIVPDAGVKDVCGNHVRGAAEACDDGNTTPNDGCSADCKTIEAGWKCPLGGGTCQRTVCGNRQIETGETCDDGNAIASDGCSATCQLEDGWTCPLVGVLCSAAACGDGKLAGSETCDDGQTPPTGGDGCGMTCQIETGYDCSTVGSPCTTAICGNGMRQGLEQCDDGNTLPFDGCSATCTNEPNCSGGTCAKACGDGVIIPGTGEACDDGNTRAGDGCSPTCTVETGFTCTLVTPPAPPSITVPVLYRDFIGYSDRYNDNTSNQDGHTDFNNPSSSGDPITFGITNVTLGTVVGDDGVSRSVPVRSGSATTAATPASGASFSDWYVTRNYTAGTSPYDTSFNRAVAQTLTLTKSGTSYVFDSAAGGSQGFFPLDGAGFVVAASTPREELFASNNGGNHNFSFTTELHYVFQYKGTEHLDFSGDDALWVFIDGQLCLDVGGLHPARTGLMHFDSINDEPNTTQRAVVTACKTYLDGKATAVRAGDPTKPVYFEMIIFHQEGHTNASNFKLTLTNFVTQTSTCAATCGDGVVASTEQCDLGAQNTTPANYGGCTTACLLGPYCGDSIVTNPPEICDDGTNLGGYNQCSPTCDLVLGCGNGVLEASEECDDGNRVDGDGCTSTCVVEIIVM